MGKRGGDTDGVRATLQAYLYQPPVPPSDAVMASLVAAALFPQLAYVRAPISKKTKKPCAPENLKLEIRDPRGLDVAPQAASLHPSSVRGRLNGSHWHSPYCCFHEKVRTTKVYVRDATPIPPLAPFLLTGNALDGDGATLVLDGWLTCVVEGGDEVVRDFRDVVQQRVSELLGGKADANPANGHALLAGLEALAALEVSPLPEQYQRLALMPQKQGRKSGRRSGRRSRGRRRR